MPVGVRDRFKAMKVLFDQLHALDEEEDMAYREIERKYEHLYEKVYTKRALLIAGELEPDETIMTKFNEMKEALVDESYEKLEVPICDVKDL